MRTTVCGFMSALLLVVACPDRREPVDRGTVDTGQGSVDASRVDARAACNETSVLFIGNSYTAVNDLPGMVGAMASSVGCAMPWDATTPGGASFATHKDSATTLAKIQARQWDVVVLQNQSQIPGFKPADVEANSLPNAVALAQRIRNNRKDTRILYMATWGRRDGDADNCAYYPLICTFAGHTRALQQGYEIYVSSTGDAIATVGLAWKAVVDDDEAPFRSDLLWAGDGSHPTLRGSYLAAATLLQHLFLRSPVGNPYEVELSSEDRTYLQTIASSFGPH